MKKKMFLAIVFTILFMKTETNFCFQTTGSDSTIIYKRLNINNISTTFSNNGLSDDGLFGPGGFKYPKDFYSTAFFYSGILWGGEINGQIKVSGVTYKSSLQANGIGKIYRVRRDYKNGDLTAEINDGEGTEVEIRSEYEKHWNEWPADQGAPFEDIDNNGTYDPTVDIPGFPGADQTIWIYTNDLDSSLVKEVFGNSSIGIELKAIYWAYKSETALGNTIFRKYIIKNISSEKINDFYCSITSDPDVGDGTDDYVGCDTLLNLAYAYNAGENDAHFNNHPPALGFVLLDGPIKNNNSPRLSSFNFIINNDGIYGYPQFGSYDEGALAFYKLFQGLLLDGKQYQIPQQLGGGYTTFPLSGNPIESEGWIDGIIHVPGNRNINLSSGPIDLLSGESVEFTFAQIAAGGTNGTSNLQAIDSLKKHVIEIQNFYKTIVDSVTHINRSVDEITNSLKLFQNYPNPFNPTTTIKFDIPETDFVTLKIYDVLGNEIKTLVNENKSPGSYNIKFNGSGLASGMYIYKLSTSKFTSIKKLLLVK